MLVLLLGLLDGLLSKAPLIFLGTVATVVFGPKESVAATAPSRNPLDRLNHALQSLQPQIEGAFPWLLGGDGIFGGASAEARGKIALLVIVAVAVVLVAALGALTQYLFVQSSRGLSLRILADIREDLAQHILKLGMRFHTGSRKGDLISRATADVNVILSALVLLFDDLVLEPAMLLGSIGVAVVGDPKLTLFVAVLVPSIVIPLAVFGRRMRKRSRKSLEALGDSTETMSQMFAGIRVVKAFRMEDRELDEFREANTRWIGRSLSVIRLKALTEGATHFLTNAGFALLIVAIGVAHIAFGLLQDVGAMFVWFGGIGTVYQHVRRISKGYQTVQESLGATDRLFEILDLEPEHVTTVAKRALSGPIQTIELRDVSFAYEDEPVLERASFRVRAGETIAVVGPSGAGKSTLIDLIARFYDPQEGSVRVNDVDIRDLDVDEWFARWAIVDQNPFLFHASIRENVAYGKPGAGDAEIRDALRAANILDFIDSLPKGVDTEVGDRGARLSGGQRQRLTIARALLKNPPILLLDEATSSLDSESEAAVRDALERLMVGRTSIVVAHRLSTIRNATRILVLERGKVVEEGTHDDLLRLNGVYRRLHDAQVGEAAA